MTPKDALLALTIIVVWGLNFVVIAWGLEDVPPLLMGGLRFLMVATIGSLIIKRPATPLKWWFLYAVPIGFGQFAFLFSAMAYGMPAGLASLVLQSQALFTLFFAMLFLKEGIKSHQLLAILVAAAGLYFIADTTDSDQMSALGFGLTLAAASSWALGNISARAIGQKGYQSNVNLVIWSSWIPPVPFFIASWWVEGTDTIVHSLTHFSWTALGALLYLALVATILGYGLWGYLMTHYPAAQVAPLTLGVPVVGLSAAALLLNETLTSMQFVGIALVLAGLLINTFAGRLKAGFRKVRQAD